MAVLSVAFGTWIPSPSKFRYRFCDIPSRMVVFLRGMVMFEDTGIYHGGCHELCLFHILDIYIYVHNFDIQNASNLCLLYHQPEFCGFQPKLFRIILFCRAEVGSRTCRPSEQCYDSPYGPSGLKTSWRSLISGKRHGTIWYSTLYWVNFITTSLFSLTGNHS